MRKLVSILLAFVLTFNIGQVFAENEQPKELSITVDGKDISFVENKPYVNEDGRLMVPVRFIAENMGCTVEWDGENQAINLQNTRKKVTLKIGSKFATVHDLRSKASKDKEFDTTAVLSNGSTYVPLRFISETFGTTIEWFEETNAISLTNEYTEYLEPHEVIRKVMDLEMKGEYQKAFAYFSSQMKSEKNIQNHKQYALKIDKASSALVTCTKTFAKPGRIIDARLKVGYTSDDEARVVVGIFENFEINNAQVHGLLYYYIRKLKKVDGLWYLDPKSYPKEYSDYFTYESGV